MEKSLKRTLCGRIISTMLSFMMVIMLMPLSGKTAYAETMVCKITESWDSNILNKEYATLQAAINAICGESGANTGTITLIADTTECVTYEGTQGLTIDLNDHVLCGDGSGSVVKVLGGNVIIQDTAEQKTTRYFTDSRCAHNITVGEACDSCGGNACKDSCYETYEGNTAETADAIAITGGVISGGCAVDSDIDNYGGGIYATGTLNLYDINIIGNDRSRGGGLYLTNNALIKDCMICGNSASDGGGIYADTNKTTIINSVISNNYAIYGGGIEVVNEDGCFLQGTQITMADGSLKNIEDVEVGESVRTFDHMTGTVSSEKVCIAYQKNGNHRIVTLHFKDNPNLSIALGHGLFEKEEGHYVTITPDNAEDYVGKHFYNAGSGSWEELENVSFSESDDGIYALVTEHHLNCIADNMLTAPKEAELILNAFEYDDSLAVDQAQLQSDIEQFGLLESEDCFGVSNQMYDIFNLKYLSISLGKKVCTEEEVRDALSFTESALQDSEEPALELQSVDTSEPDCNTYTDSVDSGTLIVGDNVVIKNNNSKWNGKNLYLNDDCYLKFIDPESASGIDIGIALDSNTGKFTKNGIAENTGFFSLDNTYDYYVKYEEADPSTETSAYLAVADRSVLVDNKVSHSTVSVDKPGAGVGEEVTLTVKVNQWYELNTITVTDNNGNELPVTDNKFTMPTDESALPVTVSSTFKPLANVKIAKNISHGTVSVNRSSAFPYQEVTVTATPDKGYKTSSITVTDNNNTVLTVTNNKFKMPADESAFPVTVTASFKAVTTVNDVKYQSSTATFVRKTSGIGTVTTYYKVNGVWTTKKPTAAGTYTVGFTIAENSKYTALGTKASPKTTSPATTYKVVDAAAVKAAKELALNKGLKITQTGSKVSITFGKVSGAAGYQIYGAYCGNSRKLLKTVKTNSVTITKLNGKALDLKKNYQFMVVAYKVVNGKKVTIVKSLVGHVVGRKNTTYTNAKSITLTKTSFTLAVGKTAAVKAKTNLVDKSKKKLTNAHAAEFRYATSNKAIATVSQKGTIKAVKKGTCYIYVFSRNGFAKSAKVTVK